MEISGTNLGEAAVGRVDKPGGLCQAFGLPTRAPTDDAPVRPQSAGVVKASRDLCEWDVRTPDWSGIRRDFGVVLWPLGETASPVWSAFVCRYRVPLLGTWAAGVGCSACVDVGPLLWSRSGVAAESHPMNTRTRVATARQRTNNLGLGRRWETVIFWSSFSGRFLVP